MRPSAHDLAMNGRGRRSSNANNDNAAYTDGSRDGTGNVDSMESVFGAMVGAFAFGTGKILLILPTSTLTACISESHSAQTILNVSFIRYATLGSPDR